MDQLQKEIKIATLAKEISDLIFSKVPIDERIVVSAILRVLLHYMFMAKLETSIENDLFDVIELAIDDCRWPKEQENGIRSGK